MGQSVTVGERKEVGSDGMSDSKWTVDFRGNFRELCLTFSAWSHCWHRHCAKSAGDYL